MNSDIDRMRMTSVLLKALFVAVGIFLIALLFIPRRDKGDSKPSQQEEGIKYGRRMVVTTTICKMCNSEETDTVFLPILWGDDSSTVYQESDGICRVCYEKNRTRAEALFAEGKNYFQSGGYSDARYYLKQALQLGHPRAKLFIDSINVKIEQAQSRDYLNENIGGLQEETDSQEKKEIASTLQAALENQGKTTDISLSGDNSGTITITAQDMDKNWAEEFLESEYMEHLRKGEFEKVFFKSDNDSFSAFFDFSN